MANEQTVFSRPAKLDNAHTVLYEIDMLRWAKARLVLATTPQEEWSYLEVFLLHFRNLIEFFGKPGDDDQDLSIRRPGAIWETVKAPDPTELHGLNRSDLWEKYDTRDNDGAISKYLHHCTVRRLHAKNWNVQEMCDDLFPVIEKFEAMLPSYKPATGFARTMGTRGSDGHSTTSARVFRADF